MTSWALSQTDSLLSAPTEYDVPALPSFFFRRDAEPRLAQQLHLHIEPKLRFQMLPIFVLEQLTVLVTPVLPEQNSKF